jgi:hypothetical protein
LVAFTLLIILLLSASYRHWSDKIKADKNYDHIKSLEDKDMIFDYLKHISTKVSSVFDKSQNISKSNKKSFMTLKNIALQFQKFIQLVVKYLDKFVNLLKPVKNTSLQNIDKKKIYFQDEDSESEELTNKILDEPNIFLNQKRNSRTKPIRPSDTNLTKDEFDKLETALLYKFNQERGSNKFKLALELASLYGQVGNKNEQKELCKWVLEKGNEESKKIASEMLIALN